MPLTFRCHALGASPVKIIHPKGRNFWEGVIKSEKLVISEKFIVPSLIIKCVFRKSLYGRFLGQTSPVLIYVVLDLATAKSCCYVGKLLELI